MTAEKHKIFGRIAYPHLTQKYLFGCKDQATADNDPKAKYETTIILDPANAATAAYQTAVKDLMAAKFGKRVSSARSGIKEGNERDSVPEGFADMLYLVAKSKKLPKFYSVQGKRMPAIEAEEKFYAGCYVNVMVQPYAYDAAGNKGVAHELLAIQFVSDGEALTGRPTITDDDFDDLSAEVAAKAAAAMES